jgi:hypothetical protein
MDMSGKPFERIATQYEGVLAITAGSSPVMVEFGRPWLFSTDAQAQALINGVGGGVFMNERWARRAEHY